MSGVEKRRVVIKCLWLCWPVPYAGLPATELNKTHSKEKKKRKKKTNLATEWTQPSFIDLCAGRPASSNESGIFQPEFTTDWKNTLFET